MALEDLRQNDMMAHLLDALDDHQDIGHYGRLVFTMIARHFLPEHQVVEYLQKNPNFSHDDARTLLKQVEVRGYTPPKREKILQWQKEQPFPICPTTDPDACNVYRNLTFPPDVYEHINEYYEEKSSA